MVAAGQHVNVDEDSTKGFVGEANLNISTLSDGFVDDKLVVTVTKWKMK